MRLLLRDGLAALVLLCCCSRPSQPVAPAGNPAAHAPAVSEASKEAPKEAAKIVDEDLKIEEREANP
jgi:hypothetical protein